MPSVVDKDDEDWIEEGLKKRKTTIRPAKKKAQDWPHATGLTGFRPSNFNFQGVNRLRNRLLNQLFQQNNVIAAHSEEDDGELESPSKPRRINTSITYFQNRKPEQSSPNSHDYSIRYGNENIETFSEDYDSDRDGFKKGRKSFVFHKK